MHVLVLGRRVSEVDHVVDRVLAIVNLVARPLAVQEVARWLVSLVLLDLVLLLRAKPDVPQNFLQVLRVLARNIRPFAVGVLN